MHVRKRIRDGVCTLVGNLGTTRARVYNSRSFSLKPENLPSLSVYTTEEEIQQITLGTPLAAPRLHRNLTLVIEAHALADEQVEDVLDQIADEVEVGMSAPLTIDGQNLSTQLTATTQQTIDEAGTPVGVLRLVYTIPYSTGESTPSNLN